MRWGRVVTTVLIASALVGLWVAQRRGLFDPPSERVVPAISPVASAIAASGATRLEGAAAAAAAPAKAASSVEIYCGLGAASFDPDDEAQRERITTEAAEKLQAHRARVLPGWLEEMKSSPDVQVQAAAWFLEARQAGLSRLEGGQKSGLLDSLDELARLAQRSRDPVPYAWAYESCEMYRATGVAPACAALSAEEWAARDPGNGFPWLFAAGQAGVDAPRRSAYIEKALAADVVRSSWGGMFPVLARAAPPHEAPLDRSVRFVEALSADAFVASSQGVVIGHCSDNELRQGARRQQCERLAAFLTEKSDSLLSFNVGVGIGRRLGWSQDRLARLKAETESLQEAMPDGAAIAGCAGLARGEAYFADVAKYGELGALRRRQPAASAATR